MRNGKNHTLLPVLGASRRAGLKPIVNSLAFEGILWILRAGAMAGFARALPVPAAAPGDHAKALEYDFHPKRLMMRSKLGALEQSVVHLFRQISPSGFYLV
jgi:hypothetical protein